MKQISPLHTIGGYSPGHPWFYILDGAILSAKQIRAYAQSKEYGGYRTDEILTAHRRPEPKRSKALRTIRADVLNSLRADLSRYREVARELRTYRRNFDPATDQRKCAAVHTSMSLKFAHLHNGFANLRTLDSLPSEQLDLFGLE